MGEDGLARMLRGVAKMTTDEPMGHVLELLAEIVADEETEQET